MQVTEIVDGIIDLIKKNMIAKTNVSSNILQSNVASIENSFHFDPSQEVVLMDMGYNNESYSGTSHYQILEYARVESVSNSSEVILYDATDGNWYTSDGAFMQKTIGHSPLYDEHVYYGDREVIPSDTMAITIEPSTLTNEWLYIQGGLSEEYNLEITIYGKHIDTENGMRILNKYADAVYKLLIENIEMDLTDHETPILSNVSSGTKWVVIEDNATNREKFTIDSNMTPLRGYDIQDNNATERGHFINKVEYGIPAAGQMRLTMTQIFDNDYLLYDYAILRKKGRRLWDSRVSDVDFGVIQKGSAILRSAKLHWFGKELNEQSFPQVQKRTELFQRKTP